jgi:DNA-binding FadR family transcriptional regulator
VLLVELTEPRRGVPLPAQVAGQIRELISSGAWAVGTRIPPEGELVRLLGISRNSVREALRTLVHTGLLEARVGDGTYVRARDELQVMLQRRIAAERVDDVFEVRALLEQRGARSAATHASDADLAAMREALRARDSARDYQEFVEHDLRFHQAVVDASGNRLLAELYRDLDAISAQLTRLVGAADFADFLRSNRALNEKHQELLTVISAREPGIAETIAGEIVNEARTLHVHLTGRDGSDRGTAS